MLPLLVLLLLGGASAAAEMAAPRLEREAELPHGMGSVRRLSLHLPADRPNVHQRLLAVTLVPGAFHARLLDQSPTFPLGARTVAQSLALVPGAVVALNAGYFDGRFQPVGLCRIAGTQTSDATDALSGILAIDTAGALRLLARTDAHAQFPSAVQAGPFVIDPGGVLGVRPQAARAPRSLIASDDHGRVLLLATGALTLHQLATLLLEHGSAFGLERVERALNLDGGPSTGLALAWEGKEWSLAERGPVRNVLVIAPAGR